ncbi:MAG: glycoside hydrolase family 13 [Ferruginibacter sp.]|nr:glycoside hydrolase family 13 [Ferruginibacter sp.]
MTTKITFTLPAANIIGASECVLLGEFNNWNLDEGVYLTKQADGSMTAEVELEPGDYQYRYLLSNGRWVNDNGEKITSEMHGYPVENCIVRVAALVNETIEAPKTTKPKSVKKNAEAKPKTVKAKAAAKTVAKTGKDDLSKIEGIGKKIAELLNNNNITSFKELSQATAAGLKTILATGGSRFSLHKPGSWPKQAKLAADGKWDELKELQKELKGGK